MPSFDVFADAMGRYGASADSRIVLYDAGAHAWATRLWWMLRAAGFDNAAVLNGGMKKWRAEGRPVSTAPCAYPQAQFAARPRAGMFVGRDKVSRSLADGSISLINALSADEPADGSSHGETGRIPGSGNVPAASLLDPVAELSFAPTCRCVRCTGALDGRSIITGCGGGIAATSVAFTWCGWARRRCPCTTARCPNGAGSCAADGIRLKARGGAPRKRRSLKAIRADAGAGASRSRSYCAKEMMRSEWRSQADTAALPAPAQRQSGNVFEQIGILPMDWTSR